MIQKGFKSLLFLMLALAYVGSSAASLTLSSDHFNLNSLEAVADNEDRIKAQPDYELVFVDITSIQNLAEETSPFEFITGGSDFFSSGFILQKDRVIELPHYSATTNSRVPSISQFIRELIYPFHSYW